MAAWGLGIGVLLATMMAGEMGMGMRRVRKRKGNEFMYRGDEVGI